MSSYSEEGDYGPRCRGCGRLLDGGKQYNCAACSAPICDSCAETARNNAVCYGCAADDAAQESEEMDRRYEWDRQHGGRD